MATTINAGRVRFVSRGTYNNSTQYYLFDLVDYNGSSYIAKENSLGNLPTNTQYWQLIAEKGNTGSTGQTGPVGATGNGISSITKTGTSGLVDTYTITYTNGNTTTFTITNGEDGEVTETELDVLREKVANQQKVINQLPQVTGQGTEVTLQDTIEAPFTEFDVEGNSVQDGTTSPDNEVPIYSAGDNENLLPNNIISQTLYGVEITKNKDGSVKLNGTSTNAFNLVLVNDLSLSTNQYTMSLKNRIIGIGIYAYVNNELKAFVSASLNDESTTFTLNENTIFNEIRLYVPSGSSFNNLVVYPKLEKGNKASGYSPYGMGSINEKIQTRNFLNLTGVSGTNNGISYSVNEKGKLVLNGTCSSDRITIILPPTKINGTYTFSRSITNLSTALKNANGTNIFIVNPNIASNTATVNDTIKQLVIYMASGTQFSNKEVELQVELGSTSNPFVEHKKQDYSIPVQQPFRSIGDVRDKFVKVNGNWFERHYVLRKIFTGTENLIYLDNHGNYYRYYILNFQNGTGIRPVLSNYFIDRGNQAFGEYNFIQLTGNDFYLQIENITTLADLKTWLSEQYANGKPVYVDYLLAEPQDLPCTEEQIEALENKPSTYKGFTIINSEDETPAYLEVSGIYDLNNLINN